MAIIVPNAGELALLTKLMVNTSNIDDDFELRLFTNSEALALDTVVGDLTEATFTGYSAKILSRSGFDAPVTLGTGEASITYGTEQSWTVGATGETVYGYYVTDATSGTLLWFETIEATTLTSGSVLRMTPSFTLRSRS